MRHELLTQCALFYWIQCKKGHAESALRDACRTSSGLSIVALIPKGYSSQC